MSSIPLVALQVRPPAADVTDRVRNVVSLRDMMNQSQRVKRDQDIWQEAYSANDGDPEKTVAQAIKNGASPESVQAFQQRQAILRQQIAQRDEMELRNFNTRAENLRRVLKPIADLARTGGETEAHEVGHSGQATPPATTGSEDPNRDPGLYPEPQLGSAGQTGPTQPGQAQGSQTGQPAPAGVVRPLAGGGVPFDVSDGYTPEKQQLWTKARDMVLSNPQIYGITDPQQVPQQYLGDHRVRNLYATLDSGQQLVQQDLRRRTTVTAPNGQTYTFPDEASADQFRQKAGIR